MAISKFDIKDNLLITCGLDRKINLYNLDENSDKPTKVFRYHKS